MLAGFIVTLAVIATVGSGAALSVTGATAPVEVYAGDFISIIETPLVNHPIDVYINTYDVAQAQHMSTDAQGWLRLPAVPVGAKIFFNLLDHGDYHQTMTAIATVPPTGLVGLLNRVVLQVPSHFIYDLFTVLVPGPMDKTKCQVVVTITNFNRTYTNCPQGWPGIVATITPQVDNEVHPYYFGTWGGLSNKTNPLPNNLTSTSWDGGVIYRNVDVNTNQDITLGAVFGNFNFTTTTVRCLAPNMFINAAPNQGPRSLEPIQDGSGDEMTSMRQELEAMRIEMESIGSKSAGGAPPLTRNAIRSGQYPNTCAYPRLNDMRMASKRN